MFFGLNVERAIWLSMSVQAKELCPACQILTIQKPNNHWQNAHSLRFTRALMRKVRDCEKLI